ncbi:MAG: methyltransferase, partial [Cyclobacteriaceae bacterium]
MKSKHQSEPFRFKQFSVNNDKCAMKVGTDAVLLGAWMDLDNAQSILEIGTGSGVIALMVAQRTPADAHIDAIEIEEQDATQAKENVKNSPWPSKIGIHQAAFQDFENKTKYDLIFSNPPYFNKSLLPPSSERSRVRHTNTLSYEELIVHSLRLINTKGKLAVILP